jgi:molybdopterin converting factor small subunit
MKIRVRLYATLRQYIPNAADFTNEKGVEVADDTTVGRVMEMLRLPENLRVLALLNGTHCKERETNLKDGDVVLFYPLMSGG